MSKNSAEGATVSRLVRFEELRSRIGYTRSYILRLEKSGKFPKRVKLGNNSVAWLESDVNNWINEKVAARDAGTPASQP